MVFPMNLSQGPTGTQSLVLGRAPQVGGRLCAESPGPGEVDKKRLRHVQPGSWQPVFGIVMVFLGGL